MLANMPVDLILLVCVHLPACLPSCPGVDQEPTSFPFPSHIDTLEGSLHHPSLPPQELTALHTGKMTVLPDVIPLQTWSREAWATVEEKIKCCPALKTGAECGCSWLKLWAEGCQEPPRRSQKLVRDLPEMGPPLIKIYHEFAPVGKAQEKFISGNIPAINILFLLLLNIYNTH